MVRPARALALLCVCVGLSLMHLGGESRADEGPIAPAFDDPMLPVTAGLPGCASPAAPRMNAQEVREAAHVRAQHGTSCFQSGRCRLPNSYLYDREIIPRVQQYLRQDRRFADTTLWVRGERRLVFVMGCVRSADQARQVREAVGLVDDVMGVIDEMRVGSPP